MQGTRGFGFGSRISRAPAPSLTSLVDVLMATIGIFIIVFALQEIAKPVELTPKPFDGAALCNKSGLFEAYLPDGSVIPLDAAALSESLAAAFPEGGAILVGITPGCASATVGNRAAPLVAALARRELGRSETETGEPLHRLEIAPVENGGGAWADLVKVAFAGDRPR